MGKSGGCNFLARQVSAGRVRCWTRALLTFCAADVQAIQHEGAHHLLCFCQHAQTLAKMMLTHAGDICSWLAFHPLHKRLILFCV